VSDLLAPAAAARPTRIDSRAAAGGLDTGGALWPTPPRFAAAHIVAVITAGLALDALLGWTGQHLATVWACAVWIWLYRAGGLPERRSLVLCLLIAGFGEIVLSLVWGVYDYQFGNLPLFVPPGHALLMTLGVLVARKLPTRSTVLTITALGGAYAAYAWFSDHDRFGTVLFLLFALCVAFGRERRLYSVMFLLALAMELYGTALGNWVWRPLVPGLGLSAANPPFAAGAFYALLDLLVLGAVVGLARRATTQAATAAAFQRPSSRSSRQNP